MTDENLERQIAELRRRQTLQHAALAALIHILHKQIPDLKLRETIASFYAETIMHHAPYAGPELPEALEEYLTSLIIYD